MQSKKMLWTGRIISALVILFMLADSVGKVVKFAPYLEGTVRVGYPASLVVPRATATHVRVGQPFWFPIMMGVLVWAGLFLRDDRLGALIPLRK
jgi:hypothetical protein